VAAVRFGEKHIQIEADNLGELCRELIKRYGSEMSGLLDSEGKISKATVIFVDRRNAYTLSGAATPLKKDSEVLIMPILAGG
jgi:molybdopterin converting factor small subunit